MRRAFVRPVLYSLALYGALSPALALDHVLENVTIKGPDGALASIPRMEIADTNLTRPEIDRLLSGEALSAETNALVAKLRAKRISIPHMTFIAGGDEKGSILIRDKLVVNIDKGRFERISINGVEGKFTIPGAGDGALASGPIVLENGDFSSLLQAALKGDVLEIVSEPMAQLYRIVPLALEGNRLTIASAEPQKIQVADELRVLLGYDIKVCVSTEPEIQKAIEKYYSSATDTVESIVDKLEGDKELEAAAAAAAAKDGPIVPLIAETGGINAMIVDATALPEQVADDVTLSAFRSAGQRCSALRLLCVQEDVADKMVEMIVGAAKELRLGDPREIATHIGPVIDAEAKGRLDSHIEKMKSETKTRLAGKAPEGLYVAPHVFELKRVEDLKEEVFGPILHVVRYKAGDLAKVIAAIEATGYGLTLGIHSRIDAEIERITEELATGNIYVNRNMIGAVVGVQPFGGHGLSGTGPKAGGPNYLFRFATEQVISVNSAAAGGNASLMALEEG